MITFKCQMYGRDFPDPRTEIKNAVACIYTVSINADRDGRAKL